MIKIVKLEHASGTTAIDLTKVIAVSYCKAADVTDIYLKGGHRVMLSGKFIDSLCSLIAMVEAEDE